MCVCVCVLNVCFVLFVLPLPSSVLASLAVFSHLLVISRCFSLFFFSLLLALRVVCSGACGNGDKFQAPWLEFGGNDNPYYINWGQVCSCVLSHEQHPHTHTLNIIHTLSHTKWIRSDET